MKSEEITFKDFSVIYIKACDTDESQGNVIHFAKGREMGWDQNFYYFSILMTQFFVKMI